MHNNCGSDGCEDAAALCGNTEGFQVESLSCYCIGLQF